MRWDDLFADLDAQAAALEVAERAAEVDERARIEFASVPAVARLRASLGDPVRLRLLGGLDLTGTLARVGPDWLLCVEGGGREAVVALRAVRQVHGLSRFSLPPSADSAANLVRARLTLATALRGIARDRSGVRVHLVDGDTVDATIDRVGADFVEVAVHPAGEARRRGEVRDIVLLSIPAIAAVRRASG